MLKHFCVVLGLTLVLTNPACWAGSGANRAPTVSLTAPSSRTIFTAPANITLSATASDRDGTIAKIEFYQGTTLVGSSTVAPYSVIWANHIAGTYSLTAKATDNLGAATTSSR